MEAGMKRPWADFIRSRRQPLTSRLGGPERLEPWTLFSGVSVVSAGIEWTEWRGHAVEARIDQWVGRLAAVRPAAAAQAAYGSPVLVGQLAARHPGWHASSLGGGFFSLSTPGATRQTVLDWAACTKAVARLEPDLAIRAASLPNDPLLASQWNLQNNGQYAGTIGNDINAARAWSLTTGARNVVVAVIDSGIDIHHPDLAANIWTNPNEAGGNAIDDDRNGYTDDIHGWNFVDDNNQLTDGYGHGTHVAGIIGAVGNNGLGVAGIAWQVSLLPLKVQDSRGIGSTSAVLKALNYITMMRRDHGINIVVANASWESAAGYSLVVQEAIRAEGNVGVTFVAAAGNQASNNDAIPRYPANYQLPNLIAVAALSTTNTLASMSNYGGTTVDLAAPGSLIQSTFPGGTYGILSGTSMAAPQVSGVVALLAAAKPGITLAEVRAAILGTTTPVAGLLGKTATGGRLNAAAALASLGVIAPAPTPPSLPVATPPARSLMLPFSDAFNRPAGPVAEPDWVQAVGRIAISANTAISTSGGNSVMVLGRVSVADVHLRAKVTVRAVNGQAVGLVARYGGSGDSNMYLARLVKRPAGFVGQIWRNVDGVWQLLASRAAPRGGGLMQFDVVGNSLALSFNGRLLVGIYDDAISRPGSVGARISGIGNRLDDFSAV